MAKAVRLSDIAERLQVSTVTVSKALSGQKGVSQEQRNKIMRLAEEMGYKPIHKVDTKKKYDTVNSNIGVLVSAKYIKKYESFYWLIYEEVATRAVKRGCFTMFETLSPESEELLILPKLIKGKKVDGLIIIGKLRREYLSMLQNNNHNIPLLYLDFYDETTNTDAVISDSFYGMYQVTNYLFQMGHRNIAYVGTLTATSSITDRYYGYAKSLLEHGIREKPEWVIDDRDINSGKVFIKLPEIMPTAFVCNCDLIASELIKLLGKEGYRVPDDISVAGFDNFLYPGLCNVPITTYEVDVKEMAKVAVNIILKRISGETSKAGVSIVVGHLVIKNSVNKI